MPIIIAPQGSITAQGAVTDTKPASIELQSIDTSYFLVIVIWYTTMVAAAKAAAMVVTTATLDASFAQSPHDTERGACIEAVPANPQDDGA